MRTEKHIMKAEASLCDNLLSEVKYVNLRISVGIILQIPDIHTMQNRAWSFPSTLRGSSNLPKFNIVCLKVSSCLQTAYLQKVLALLYTRLETSLAMKVTVSDYTRYVTVMLIGYARKQRKRTQS